MERPARAAGATDDIFEVEGTQDAEAARLIRPRVRVFEETLWIDRGEGLGTHDFAEDRAPVIALSFEYEGFHVRAADPRACVTMGDGVVLRRDAGAESQARYTLEALGAIELEALEDRSPAPDSEADYLVQLEGDTHLHCNFTAHGLPQLRALGWEVEVDPQYPYHVLRSEPPWYAELGDGDERPNWFSLELGVEVSGQRVNLLPVLLDLLDDTQGSLDFSAQYARGSRVPRFVKMPGGHYLEVPPERFKTLMQVMGELYQGDGRGVGFPAIRAHALHDLVDAFGGAGSETPLRLRGLHPPRRVTLPEDDADAQPPATGPLRATLRPYQVSGLCFLQRLRTHGYGGILADDMGLGKTLQTIAHLCVEHRSERPQSPSLVVAPTSLIGNWQRELSRFAPHLEVVTLVGKRRQALRGRAEDADVVLTSYPILVRDADYFETQAYHLAILDEAQAIKNPRSLAHAAACALDSSHRLCLTGTPIENGVGELWSLFEFLSPGLLGSAEQFHHFFKYPIEQQQDELRLQALRQQVRPFILRRMKNAVAKDLPPKSVLVRPVELTGKQRDLYESIRVAAHDQVRMTIRKKGFASSTITILDALMKLRQLCCDPRLVPGDAARFVRESAKYDALFGMLERLLPDGHRVLVFSQFTRMLSLIAAGLRERRLPFLTLTGATQNRQARVDAFERGEADVFLISLKAGGTGLNLVGADTVIHYDPWWNPAAQDQATDRAYRIGQTRPVFAYNLIAAGSVEERMLGLQERKRRLASEIVGGASGTGGKLDEAEIEHLLSPLA